MTNEPKFKVGDRVISRIGMPYKEEIEMTVIRVLSSKRKPKWTYYKCQADGYTNETTGHDLRHAPTKTPDFKADEVVVIPKHDAIIKQVKPTFGGTYIYTIEVPEYFIEKKKAS